MFSPSGLLAVARDGSRKQPVWSDELHVPVLRGSAINTTPPVDRDCEKSPARSSAVGTVTKTGSVGVIVCGLSYEKKKKALSFQKYLSGSPNLGNQIGPPKLNPQILCRYKARGSLSLLLK